MKKEGLAFAIIVNKEDVDKFHFKVYLSYLYWKQICRG